jgi:hypothetical protein
MYTEDIQENGRLQPCRISVRSAGKPLTNVVMADKRWPASEGWAKMEQNINGIKIHYVVNTITGAVDDFKFVVP